MKAKRIMSIFLVFIFIFSIVGCKDNPSESVSSDISSDIWGDEVDNNDVTSTETDSSNETEETESNKDTGSSKVNSSNTSSKNNGFGTVGSKGNTMTEAEIEGLPALSSKVKNKTVRLLTHANVSNTDKSITKRYISQYDLTVQYITVPYESKRTKLVQMVAAGDAPDLISMDEGFMTLINNNLCQPVEQYVDFSDKIWDSVRNLNENRKINGKTYELILHAVPSRMFFFNAKLFKESGINDPLYYYEKGQWDWDKMVELAKKMTKDLNNDGVNDQYGFGGESLQFMCMGSVNQAFITMDSNGKIKNNMKNADLAKAMKFFVDLQTTYKIWPSSPSFTNILNGKLAMGYFGAWNINSVDGAKKMWKSGDLKYVPTPSAPGMKNYNFPVYESMFIPVGAKNPYGAAAFVVYEKYREAAPITVEQTANEKAMAKIYAEASKNLMTNITNRDFDFAASYEWGIDGDLLNGKSWSTVVEEYSPKIDSKIAELN